MKTSITLCLLAGTCVLAQAKDKPNKPGKGHHGPPPPEILAKFDKDGDGKLSDEEHKAMREAMKERHKEMREKFDKDGDGKLSEEEREAMKEARKAKMLEKFDKDGDGTLSEEEKEAMPDKFKHKGPKGQGRKGKGAPEGE